MTEFLSFIFRLDDQFKISHVHDNNVFYLSAIFTFLKIALSFSTF